MDIPTVTLTLTVGVNDGKSATFTPMVKVTGIMCLTNWRFWSDPVFPQLPSYIPPFLLGVQGSKQNQRPPT